MPTTNPESKALSAMAAAMGWIVRAVNNDADLGPVINGNIGHMPFSENMKFPAVAVVLNHGVNNTVLSNVLVNATIEVQIFIVTKEDAPVVAAKLSNWLCNLLHDRFNTDNSPIIDGGITYGTVTACTMIQPVFYSTRDKEETIWQCMGGLFSLTVE